MTTYRFTQQYAALPWRNITTPEVLLITSRETQRWIIPKGWPMRKLSGGEAATQEAYEEAGVKGVVSPLPIGHYYYRKTQVVPPDIICRVDVYSLHVSGLLMAWPEQAERVRRWFSPQEASALVQEPDLAVQIEQFFAGLETTV